MDSIFLKILNMSTGACYVIVAVLIARLLLRRAPKIYSYLLWAVVGFRLCCPFSFQSGFSLFSVKPLQNTLSPGFGASNPVFFPEVYDTLEMMAEADFGALVLDTAGEKVTLPVPKIMYAAAAVWAAGLIILLVYGIWNYLQIRRGVRTAVRLEDNVWQSEAVPSPFILGFLYPKIYIPYNLSEEKLTAVLEHEFTHLRRKDHLVKYVSFLLLAVHWFNPLVWLAFHLMGKDMEMSCDEAVLKRMKGDREADKKSYGTTLLDFSVKGRFPAPGPLAFGESAVKSRIKNILRWKEPKRWVSVCAVVFCLAVMGACAANPVEWSDEETLLGVSGAAEMSGRDETGDVSAEEDDDTLTPEQTEGILLVEKLIKAWNQDMWNCVITGMQQGTTFMEVEESTADGYYGNYSITGLQLAEDVLPGTARVTIQPSGEADGGDHLTAALLQPAENGPQGMQIMVVLEAAIADKKGAEIERCTFDIYPNSVASSHYEEGYSFTYENLNLQEEMIEDMALCIYRYVPEYAVHG